MVSEARALNVGPGPSPARAAEALKAALKKLKSLTTARTEKAFRDLRYEADQLIGVLEGTSAGSLDIHQAVNHFVDHYRTVWRDYCVQHLRPDAAFYEELIDRVRRTEGEAWAICLQQREMFPQMRNMTRLDTCLRTWLESQIAPEQQVRARLVVSRMDELKREFNVTGTVPTQALREIFLRAGVPFHLILMKSPRIIADEDFELREVGQDYEDALKQISRATGGYLAFNNNALEALKEAANVEDYHYVLVYSGRAGRAEEKREIRVRVRRPGVEVISLKNYVPPAPPALTLCEVAVDKGRLTFAVKGCRMTGGGDGRRGRAEVRVTIYDLDGKAVFDQGKVLEISKKETRISLDPGVGRGDFVLTIRAIDLLANLSDTYSGPISF